MLFQTYGHDMGANTFEASSPIIAGAALYLIARPLEMAARQPHVGAFTVHKGQFVDVPGQYGSDPWLLRCRAHNLNAPDWACRETSWKRWLKKHRLPLEYYSSEWDRWRKLNRKPLMNCLLSFMPGDFADRELITSLCEMEIREKVVAEWHKFSVRKSVICRCWRLMTSGEDSYKSLWNRAIDHAAYMREYRHIAPQPTPSKRRRSGRRNAAACSVPQ